MRCLQHAFKSLEKLLSKQTKLVQKSEKKVNVLLGGYITRQKNLLSRLQQLHRDTDMSRINFLCFSKLARHEQKSEVEEWLWWIVLALRMKMAKESLKKEKERHSLLQKRYKELLSQLEWDNWIGLLNCLWYSVVSRVGIRSLRVTDNPFQVLKAERKEVNWKEGMAQR